MALGPPPLIALLKAASQDRADLTLGDFRAEQVHWAVETGLGPWLRRCTRNDATATTSPVWPLVQGADLTARVIVAEQLDALEEILDACEDHAPPLTLLKGAALCHRHYPEPHLRLMGDLDLLTDPASVAVVESRLRRLGYVHRSDTPPQFYDTHHHITPLFHPGRRVWVEVHRGLVPPNGPLGSDRVFSRDHVDAALQPSTFRGRRVNRLGDELQVVYLASHWACGLRRVGGMVGMLDVSRLLTHATGLHWSRLLACLEDSSGAATCLYLLLSYLRRRGVTEVDSALLRALSARPSSLGAVNLAILHAVIDHHVIGGRELGGLLNGRNVDIVLAALLSPGRPSQNLLRAVWTLLPSRVWFTEAVGGRAAP